MTQDLCREAFEKWYCDQNDLTKVNSDNDGFYYRIEVQNAWEVWQAAWSQRVPDGMVVVPVEPTEEQYNAGKEAIEQAKRDGLKSHAAFSYSAMIQPFVKGGE